MKCNEKTKPIDELWLMHQYKNYKGVIAKSTEFLKDSFSKPILYYRAISYLELGKYDKALIDYKKLYQLGDSSENILHGLGIIYFNKNNFTESINLYQRLLKIKNNHAEYHYYMALNLGSVENNDEALMEYDKAIALEPYNIIYLYYAAILLQNLGEYEHSNQYLKRMLLLRDGSESDEVVKEFAMANFNKAVNYWYLQKIDTSKLNIDEAIRLDPINGKYYYERALINLQLKDTNLACLDFKKSQQLKFDINDESFLIICD